MICLCKNKKTNIIPIGGPDKDGEIEGIPNIGTSPREKGGNDTSVQLEDMDDEDLDD